MKFYNKGFWNLMLCYHCYVIYHCYFYGHLKQGAVEAVSDPCGHRENLTLTPHIPSI